MQGHMRAMLKDESLPVSGINCQATSSSLCVPLRSDLVSTIPVFQHII